MTHAFLPPARPTGTHRPQRLALQLACARLRPPWCTWPDCASLRFVAARIEPSCPFLEAVHIHGVPAQRLQGLQVRDDRGLLFEMDTLTDTLGRPVSAGEIVQSICHQLVPHRLTLTSEAFRRALLVSQAVVELQVRLTDDWGIHGIRVEGDVAPA